MHLGPNGNPTKNAVDNIIDSLPTDINKLHKLNV